MEVKVRLFGILRSQWNDYNHEMGVNIDLWKGATVNDLVNTLEIDRSWIGMVCINNQNVDLDDSLQSNDLISIFQPICGG